MSFDVNDNEDELDYEEDDFGLSENEPQKQNKIGDLEQTPLGFNDDFLDIDLLRDESLTSRQATPEAASVKPKLTPTEQAGTSKENEEEEKKEKSSLIKKQPVCKQKKNIAKFEGLGFKIPKMQPKSCEQHKKTKKKFTASAQQKDPRLNCSFGSGNNVLQSPGLALHQRVSDQLPPHLASPENVFRNRKKRRASSALGQGFMAVPQNPLPLNKIIPHSRFQMNGLVKFFSPTSSWKALTSANPFRPNFDSRNKSFNSNNFNPGVAEHNPDFRNVPATSVSSFPSMCSKPRAEDNAGQTNFNAVPASTAVNNPEGSACYPGNKRSGDSNGLKMWEKDLVKMKKEARLRRFGSDKEPNGESRTGVSIAEERELLIEDDYLRKIEDQKRLREEVLSLKEKQREVRNSRNEGDLKSGPAAINKESLLSMKNPFDNIQATVGIKVKKELNWAEDVNQNVVNELEITLPWENKKAFQAKILEEGPSESAKLRVVKNGTDNVAFIRTISKSYDELGLSKLKFLNSLESLRALAQPNSQISAIGALKAHAEQPQVEAPQLTGCVVKVLNIPQSTTAEDIHVLCRPIGKALEVKLNIPKENSALIRFGKPSCADNFYSLYHGQKMQNYFLNVIVI